MLSNNQIQKFQTLFFNHFGKKISRDEAIEKGLKLVRLLELTYKPIKKSDFEKFQNQDK